MVGGMFDDYMLRPALVAQRANMLAELQCGPGWLAQRRGFDSRPDRYRGFACILFKL